MEKCANHLVWTKFLLEGLECYKDTQMKAYNITKLTAELKVATVYSTSTEIKLLVVSDVSPWPWPWVP